MTETATRRTAAAALAATAVLATLAVPAPAPAASAGSASGARGHAAGPSAIAATGPDVADVYTERARYLPGAGVPVVVELANGPQAWSGPVDLQVTHLAQTVATDSQHVSLAPGERRTIAFTWTAPGTDFRGYLARVSAGDGEAVTAVDVSSDWTRFPRYGWLSEYPVGESAADTAARVDALVRDYHVNAIQFYDWMWRHEQVIRREGGVVADTWDDWSGKTISRPTVENAIEAAHDAGVAAMPYAMAYAGLQGYEQQSGVSPEWGIFSDTAHQHQFQFDFGDQDPLTNLWLFNPADPDWQDHIIGEYLDQVATMDFDGAHIDQLGQRDGVFDFDGNPVDLAGTFASLVNATKSELAAAHPGQDTVTFNIVNGAAGGWAAEEVAANADVDFLYSEIWENAPTYQSIKNFVTQARADAGGTAMTLAAYLNFEENAGPRYEAEDATLSGVAVDTDHPGYTGTGFVDQYGEAGDYVEFNITVPEERTYALVFRYGNATGGTVDRTVSVDGAPVGQVAFPTNAGWDTWEYDAYLATPLTAGSHTVRLAADTTGFINLDSLTLGTFNEPSVRLAGAAFAAAGASHIEMGEADQMLAHPYFPNRYKQMPLSLEAAMHDHYDFITAYQNLLFDPAVRATDSGTQFVTIAGQPTSGDASGNTIWTALARDPDHDLIHLVNLLGNDDQWRNTAATPPTLTNLDVRYYLGPDADPTGVHLASPDLDHGVSTSLPFTTGTDAAGRYVEFTVPSLEYWDLIYISRDFTAPPADRYEAELATKTNVTTGTNHPGYTGTGFVDNFATPGTSGVSFVVEAATEGDHELGIRFGNGGTPATRAVVVDGQLVERVDFPALGTWDAWSLAEVTTHLTPGLHTVVIWYQPEDAGAINVDHLAVTPVP